ncbi:MAG: ATP-binding protein [Acidobacteriota bacterium]
MVAKGGSGTVTEALFERLTESLEGALPSVTPRRLFTRASFPGKATAVIGMRRAGKSSFLHQLRGERLEAGVERERLPFVNFEDERLSGLEVSHLTALVEEYYRRYPSFRGKATVTWCFDEIQVVPGWERFVRRLLDSERCEVFLSGSSAALLSREVATAMRGRGWEVLLHPFSFEEALRHAGFTPPERLDRVSSSLRSELEHRFLAYLRAGGFPEAQGLEEADRNELLLRYVDVAILRDVAERHAVSNLTALRAMVRHLLGNPGGLFSVEKFHARLKAQGLSVSRDTLHALLGYLEDCFLIRPLWMEARSERQRMVNPRKVYPVDPALSPIFDWSGKANLGHALETAVRLELERRRAEVTYVKTPEGFEVDFLAKWPGKRPSLVQVAADLRDEAVAEREARGLLAAKKRLPRASLHLVTLTPEAAANLPAEISVVAAWRWFLEGTTQSKEGAS